MSKELEALECIVVDLTPIAKEHNKEEIEQLKKSLEALEIIKEKRVNVEEFIVISNNCKRPIISSLPFDELQLYAKGRTKYAICYGAIWTEWGLKYIAKMNSKGELELL